MDRISNLPEEIITKILSFLETKDVMGTMVLSKRWKSLWMLVPRLKFADFNYLESLEPEYWKFQRFVDRSLMLRQGQVLQSLYLKLAGQCTDADIALWVGTAVKFGLMELKVRYGNFSPRLFPKSLYTCETLVVLKLENGTLDVPHLVSLLSLKTLSLKWLNFSDPDCLLRLLPNCPILEDLFIEQWYKHVDAVNIKIVVHSLKKLYLLSSSYVSRLPGVLIDAPCLKYLNIDDEYSFTLAESINSSELVEANVKAKLSSTDKLLQSLASVERLRLCVEASEVVYPVDSCFHRLKQLEICTCKFQWLYLFIHVLQSSPNLKVIKINKCHSHKVRLSPWNEPGPIRCLPSNLEAFELRHYEGIQDLSKMFCSVPRCLSSNLETFEWRHYQGTQEEKEVSTYILKNAGCLKKASFITAKFIDDYKTKLEMLQALAFSPRISPTCELVFN